MKHITEIKETIIQIQDGTLHISFGKVNRKHSSYHDRVFIEHANGGTEILVKGYELCSKIIYDSITEYDENFKKYEKELINFKEDVRLSSGLIDSFKYLTIDKYKNLSKTFKYVKIPYEGKRYIYLTEHWSKKEYKANNWIITEL